MLPARAWKFEAITRLLASVFLCVYAGAIVTAAVHAARLQTPPGRKFWLIWSGALVCLAAALWLVRKGWRLDQMKNRLAATLICFYAGTSLGWWAQHLAGTTPGSVAQMIVAALSFQGATLALTHFFLREHEMGWKEAFGLTHRTRAAVVYGLCFSAIFLPLAWVMQWGVAQLLTHFHLPLSEQQAVQTLQMADTWHQRVALGFITILLVPPAEEALFRGILYPWVRQLGFPRVALWGTSILFAAVHMNLLTFLPLTLLALVLTTLYQRTGNLVAPIAAHALFNASNFILLLLIDQ